MKSLEYYKYVLDQFTFDETLFGKEVKKAYSMI